MSNESFPENNQYAEQQISPIGPRLKNAREEMRLTITDVARQLRLANERIESLENDNYKNMPGITFVKGYLRAYARLVNLPADELISDFEHLNLMPETKSFILSSYRQPILLSKKSMHWIIYLIGIGLLILAATWWNSLSNNDPANLNSAASQHQPVKNASQTGAAANTAPDTLKNPGNSVPTAQPAKNAVQEGVVNTAPAVSTADASHSQEGSMSATSPASPTTPTSTLSASTEPSEKQTTVGNATDTTDENNDVPKPHKKPVSRSHSRPQFDEPFDNE